MLGIFGFGTLTKLGIYAVLIVVALGAIYGGYRVWRHGVWVEGRDAALEAVARQNDVAAKAAEKVVLTTDQCFDSGGSWNVSTGKCDLGGATPSGVSSLFGN